MNGLIEQYIKELEEQLEFLDKAIIRGVGSWDDYNKATGKRGGIAAALETLKDKLAALEKLNG